VNFSSPFWASLRPPLSDFFVQRLTRDAAEMVELQEEVTQTRAATIMSVVATVHLHYLYNGCYSKI
jgi:hypothetical protein